MTSQADFDLSSILNDDAQSFYIFSAHVPDLPFLKCGARPLRDHSIGRCPIDYLEKMQRFLREGMCENSALAAVLGADTHIAGVVISTSCDQMRRAMGCFDSVEKFFLFNLPAVIDENSVDLYAYEYARLERWIRQRVVSIEIFFSLENYRAYCQQKCIYTPVKGKINIALLGAGVTHETLFGIQNAMGHQVNIALNWLENGTRPYDVDLKDLTKESITQLYASNYGVPDPFRRPVDSFYERFTEQLDIRNVNGIIIMHPIWCDQWRAVAVRCRELYHIPILHFVTDFVEMINPSALTRIEAFIESLESQPWQT